MFGRNDAPPPENPPAEEPRINLPVLRTFKVLRLKPGTGELETITVYAHKIALADDDRTIFQTYVINPPLGVELLVNRILVHVRELEEVVTSETSSLLM
jgi:hypothetical protein